MYGFQKKKTIEQRDIREAMSERLTPEESWIDFPTACLSALHSLRCSLFAVRCTRTEDREGTMDRGWEISVKTTDFPSSLNYRFSCDTVLQISKCLSLQIRVFKPKHSAAKRMFYVIKCKANHLENV
jgi:hypothetical protein